MKQILMIAGPNGAGKTTSTLEFISEKTGLYEFINADEIAKGLSPLHPESVALAASKLMIQRVKALLNADKSFAFETTASGTNYAKHLKLAQLRGFEVNAIFLWLSSPEQAVERVAQRVKQGGHHVPEATIRRRYKAGLKNFINVYLPIANFALIINNSLGEHEIVARKSNNTLIISDQIIWRKMEQSAHERQSN